jgi:hypothetical protein
MMRSSRARRSAFRCRKHPIDSINLADPKLGLLERVNELVARAGVERRRVDLVVDPTERNVGLTVNEYETLLMQHDLVEVLATRCASRASRRET